MRQMPITREENWIVARPPQGSGVRLSAGFHAAWFSLIGKLVRRSI